MASPKQDSGSGEPGKPRGEAGETKRLHFIEQIIEEDLKTGKWDGRVHTRFPPEPNGYLHIGHAKSICLNFGLAAEYGGTVQPAVRRHQSRPRRRRSTSSRSRRTSAGWASTGRTALYYASDYFEQLYEWAVQLIKAGQGLRLRPDGRGDARVSRHADRAGPEQPLSRPHASRRTSTCSSGCGRASFPTARGRCGPRSTWPRPT